MNGNNNKSIKDTVLERMRGHQNFTALDISNSLKATCDCIRYREVVEAVREMFDLGMMEPLGYSRQLVEVTISGGTIVQSYLYVYNSECSSETSLQPPSAQSLLEDTITHRKADSSGMAIERPCRSERPIAKRVA